MDMDLSDPSFDGYVINRNYVFPSDINSHILFDEMAPILWKKNYIIDFAISQQSSEYINNIRISLGSIIALVQKNIKEDIYSKELPIRFYDYHHELIESISLGDKHSISSAMDMLICTFMDIWCEDFHLLTMDMLLIVIMDLNLFALSVKKSYKKKDRVTWTRQTHTINIIRLFFAVVERIYRHELKEMTSQVREVAYPQNEQSTKFFSDVDISSVARQIVIPFQSYLSENDKASEKNKSIRNRIPKFVHSSLMFAYLATFQIIEVLDISYCFPTSYMKLLGSMRFDNKGLLDKTFPYRELSKITYLLFRFILVFNKYDWFLSDFSTANKSFINISWFLHILRNYHVDISFFEDIVLKTFNNEVVNAISNSKKEKFNINDILDDLFQLFSFSTDRTDIHEKMKSISAFHLLKTD